MTPDREPIVRAGERAECPVCGAPGASCLPWVEKNGFAVVACPGCAHRFVRDRLDDAGLAAYYSGPYFTGLVYWDYASDHQVLTRNFRAYLRRIAVPERAGPLVEFGCAYGFFLEVARERFECYGVEVSCTAADAARAAGHRVFADAAALPPALTGTVAVACLWDTIEHLSDPAAAMAAVGRLLRPGGRLYLTTGDVLSANARRRGRHWRLLDPPQHLHYFSRASLARLGRRFGLRVEKVQYLDHRRSLRGMLNLMGRRRRGATAWALHAAARVTPPRLSVALNFRDIMFVRLVKAGNEAGMMNDPSHGGGIAGGIEGARLPAHHRQAPGGQ